MERADFLAGAAALLAAEALLCAAVFPQITHPRESPSAALLRSRRADREPAESQRGTRARGDATDRAVDELFILSRAAVLK
jgi:hypothetical protein